MKTKKPLKQYQEPFCYTLIISFVGVIITILSLKEIISTNILPVGIAITTIFIVITYFFWNERCPHCKRIFTKKEDFSKEKDLGIRNERRYFESEIFKTKEGEIIDKNKDYKLWPARFVQRHFYCKKCLYGENGEWHDDEKGVFKNWVNNEKWNPPKTKIIYVKKNKDGNYVRIGKENEKGNIIVRPLNHKESQTIVVEREQKCQVCGERDGLEVHHIRKRSEGGSNKKSNLIVLCEKHHTQADRGYLPATRLKIIVSKYLKDKSN